MATAMVIGFADMANSADFGPTDIAKAISTYEQNQIRFHRDYAGKQISFSWVFNSARKHWFGNGYIVQLGDNVTCDVNDPTTLNTVIEWNKGQNVSVIGTIDDVTFGTLELKNCNLQVITNEAAQGARGLVGNPTTK